MIENKNSLKILEAIVRGLVSSNRLKEVPELINSTEYAQEIKNHLLSYIIWTMRDFGEDAITSIRYVISIGADPYSISNYDIGGLDPKYRRILDPRNTRNPKIWGPTGRLYTEPYGKAYVLLDQRGIDLIIHKHKDGPQGRSALRQDVTSIFEAEWDSRPWGLISTQPLTKDEVLVHAPEVDYFKTIIPKDYVRAIIGKGYW